MSMMRWAPDGVQATLDRSQSAASKSWDAGLGKDKTARVWDAATAKEIKVLRGHDDIVYYAAFSPDGSRIVTASGDKTARIWDAHLQTMSVKGLLVEACARLAEFTKLTRDEMRRVAYPDSMHEVDVCKERGPN